MIKPQTPFANPTFLHSCSNNSSATFLIILGPGHPRSGQVSPGHLRKKTFQSRHGHSGGVKDLKHSGFFNTTKYTDPPPPPPAVAMVQTKVKPILFSSEC